MYSPGSDKIKEWILTCENLMKEEKQESAPPKAEPASPEEGHESSQAFDILNKIKELATIEFSDQEEDHTAKAEKILTMIARLVEKYISKEKESNEDEEGEEDIDKPERDIGSNEPHDQELQKGSNLTASPQSGGQM